MDAPNPGGAGRIHIFQGGTPQDAAKTPNTVPPGPASATSLWDGPAAIAFSDGRQIGATLDRNGLRPARFIVTNDDLIVMSSEAGVLEFPEEQIVQ